MEVDRINPLPKDVVNRIAAGEVIQRPCNALKEMLENSIDARSTRINVILNSGGLKLIQIQDDGCGIVKQDLAIVCERFTTSKLSSFEDLKKISTFGFRGEALASITYVAHVKIATKTEATPVGYACSYRDGKMIEGTGPEPVAMNRGTTIIVEDLFFNVPQRRQAFRSAADEFRRCESVVANYAVHFASLGFSLCKSGELSFAVNTRKGSTVIENIRALHGQEIARELLPLAYSDDKIGLDVKGYITKANYSNKKRTHLILFINNRLVDSAAIRSCLDTIYQRYLRKDDKPFIYLSLTMPAENVDVNVHPTKSEVGFLHQEYILEKLQEVVDRTLFECDSSRHYLTKQPMISFNDERGGEVLEPRRSGTSRDGSANGRDQQPRYDKEIIRTDSSQEKLTTFFSQQGTNGTPNEETQTILTSVLELREELITGADTELCQNLSRLTYVGFVSDDRSLIQINTSLIMVNHDRFSKALFYQCGLERFGSFPAFEFDPISLDALLALALKSPESGYKDEMNCREELVAMARKTLEARAEMLAEYFSLGIDSGGRLNRLPLLVDGLKPRPGQVPLLLLRLASDVDWENEKPCFQGVCTVLAQFYASSCSKTDLATVVFPAIRRKLKVSSKFRENLVKLTSTEELYKVFERC
ncbi:DNA mismatch repair protein Mlh1-like [Tropilaelaps mercedesae]|uniref:DNA mismatch repair protein Mlh1-like n=1 Tax=Tropilaelaps mercedesae TaxID=418985 RepID=A0A1V9XC07_9ACAR|nr:DNA mismatch repair protein Mlh1-like [Tropilaelaps mercedesae]